MGSKTGIAWCDKTFNLWEGCSKVSPGCVHCYAETRAKRFGSVEWGVGKKRRRTSPANWRQPLKWNEEAARHYGICLRCDAPVVMNTPVSVECGCGIYGTAPKTRPVLVFSSSLGDWLDPEVPAEWLADQLELIAKTPHLVWLLLTKRPELWRERLLSAYSTGMDKRLSVEWSAMLRGWLAGTPPANVWVGTTVEDQQRADERIPVLLSIPARVRFLSCEPLLEAVVVKPLGRKPLYHCNGCGRELLRDSCCRCLSMNNTCSNQTRGIDWVICGGESGSKARPFDLAWARSLRDQCAAAGVPFFMKQVGDKAGRYFGAEKPGHFNRIVFKAHHGADPAEWPADLRVQQFPEVR